MQFDTIIAAGLVAALPAGALAQDTRAQVAVISDDMRGGVIPAVGHLIPEEAANFVAAGFNAPFDEVETE